MVLLALMKEHKKLERLLLFAEVASQLSFTNAAERLGISKGYLSAQIKQLETELSTPLLVRSTRSVRLTSAGQEILTHVAEIKRTMLSVERYVRHDSQQISGLLRITAPKQFFQSVLVDICHQFTLQHPHIEFEIDSSYTKHDLVADDFDIAFRATNSPPENMIAKKVLSYSYVCCASPIYLKHFGKPNTPESLLEHQCLTALSDERWTFNLTDINIKGWLSSNDNLVLKEQAITGRGIARLPDYSVAAAIKSKQLIPLLTDYQSAEQSIYLLQPQLIHPSQKVSLFVQFVEQYIQQHIE